MRRKARSIMLNVRLRPEEVALLDEMCEQTGLNRSQVARILLRNVVHEDERIRLTDKGQDLLDVVRGEK